MASAHLSKAFDFTGEVAIVTGAGSRLPGTSATLGYSPTTQTMSNRRVRTGEIGNGRATAILLARQGAKVGLLDQNTEWAKETKRMIDLEGGISEVIQTNVTDEESCRKAVARVVNLFGTVHILVNIG
jgi:NAD(P)-dependent dehydrogenase (short-subunit alcohol dehydrogenase family)